MTTETTDDSEFDPTDYDVTITRTLDAPRERVWEAWTDPEQVAEWGLLEQLAEGSKSVGELAEPHDVSLAAVSKHLQVMEEAGLLDVEKDGRVRRCHLDAAPLSAAFGWLTRYRVFWEDRLDALENHLEEEDR